MHLNFPHFFVFVCLRSQLWNTHLLRRNWQLGHEQPPSRIVQLRRITTSSPSARNQVTYIVIANQPTQSKLSEICLYSKYGCVVLYWCPREFAVDFTLSRVLSLSSLSEQRRRFQSYSLKKKKLQRKFAVIVVCFRIAQRRILVQLCHIRQERIHCQGQHLQLRSTIQWADPVVPALPGIVSGVALALAEVPVRPSICQLSLKIVCQATWGWVRGPEQAPGVHLHLFLRARLSELTLPCQRLKEGCRLVRLKVTKKQNKTKASTPVFIHHHASMEVLFFLLLLWFDPFFASWAWRYFVR